MTETEESDKDTCPICGQSYDHTVSYGAIEQADYRERPEFRDDVAVCESPGDVSTIAYVHHERNVVVKSITRKEPDPKPQPGFGPIRDMFKRDFP